MTPLANVPAEAPWVTEMRRYFAEHGCYRAEDIYRLLGNPCEGVIIDANGRTRSTQEGDDAHD